MSSATIQSDDAVFADELVVGTSLWADAWRRLRKNKMAFISAWIVVALTLACALGPIIIKLTWDWFLHARERASLT